MRAWGVGLVALLVSCGVNNEPPIDDRPIDEPIVGGPGVRETPGLRPALAVSGDPSPSGIAIPSEKDGTLLLADVDSGEVLHIAESGGAAILQAGLPVGVEPTRLVRRGSNAWATLRGSGELVRLGLVNGALVEQDRVRVGAEPFDVVASSFADRIYVSLSQEDAVIALDARTLEEIGRWILPGEPHDLLMLPDRGDGVERVAVALARSPQVAVIQPVNGTLEWFDIPTTTEFTMAGEEILHRPRITGDMVMDGAGRLLVPVLFADTDLRPRKDVPAPDVMPPTLPPDAEPGTDPADGTNGEPPRDTDGVTNDTFDGFPGETGGRGDPCGSTGGGAYGQSLDPDCKDPGSLGRFTPVVARIGITEGKAALIELFALGTQIAGSGRVVRGYPTSIQVSTVAAPSELVWVTMPTEDAVVVLAPDLMGMIPSTTNGGPAGGTGSSGATEPSPGNAGDDANGDGISDQKDPSGFSSLLFAPRLAIETVGGPVSLVPRDGNVAPASWTLHDRTISTFTNVGDLVPAFLERGGQAAFELRGDPVLKLARVLDQGLVDGRRSFMSASDPQMAASGSGVSCDTCHSEGRNDGNTWLFEDMPRQTPSLAGRVSDTLPITWLGSVQTVADEVMATSSERMGGEGLHQALALKIGTFVDHGRPVIRPQPVGEVAVAQVARGKALFNSADVGCATCHSGTRATDGRNWRVAGFTVATNTPTLTGVGATAPYFHDGSATTLIELLRRSRDGSMGNTSKLSDADLKDLEAYLLTL